MDWLKKNLSKAEKTNSRLLEAEDIEMLDGACKPKKISATRHGISHDLTASLKLRAYDLISSMSKPKAEEAILLLLT